MVRMLLDLLRCASCAEIGVTARSAPLCPPCADSLLACPWLCSGCAGLGCSAEAGCTRPWIQLPTELPIRSFSARYLLIGQGYAVLKKWKTRSGPAFDRKVLNLESSASTLKNRIDDPNLPRSMSPPLAPVIVPIPQDPRRSRLLRANPAEKIAQHLARATAWDWRKTLAPPGRRGLRQAERSGYARYESDLRFRLVDHPPRRVILVDDFMTTGRTLRSAGAALAAAGTEEIHVFCLGFRPPRPRRDR